MRLSTGKPVVFDFPTQDELKDPLSEASARYRTMARQTLVGRSIDPRIAARLVPNCTDAIEAITIIALANSFPTQ